MHEEDIQAIRRRIYELQLEHRDLDAAVAALVAEGHPDELRIRRLKKRKLWLKDEIVRLSMLITPDIPA